MQPLLEIIPYRTEYRGGVCLPVADDTPPMSILSLYELCSTTGLYTSTVTGAWEFEACSFLAINECIWDFNSC